MSAPFVIFALPRSRTFWLSQFLSYNGWHCGHEEIRRMRSLDDVKSWLSQPNTGTAETTAAPFWRLLQDYAPDARILVVRRPVREVLKSLAVCGLEHPRVRDEMKRLDHKLDQIEVRANNCLTVRYDSLNDPSVARVIFEHCLPCRFDPSWHSLMQECNLQVPMSQQIRYVNAHRPQIEKLAKLAAHASRAQLARKSVKTPDGFTIQAESFDSFYRDGKALMEAHVVAIGEAPDSHLLKNIALMRQVDYEGRMVMLTARSNGRMFGYLMTILAPSFESPDLRSAIQLTHFASPDAPGLGMTMQRMAVSHLKAEGRDEVFFRAGPRGDGPRMASVYKRLGAVPDGELFRLNLRAH